MKGLLFVDTSAWFAYANKSDRDRTKVMKALLDFEGRLVTSNFVFEETVTLCRYRLGHQEASRVGELLWSGHGVDLIRADANDEATAWELFKRKADSRYSFTDCVSFAMMRRLGIGQVAALDNDFRIEGFDVVPKSS